MTTKVIKIDPNNIDLEAIDFCADVIEKGGLVCFPTETVYGLGANCFNEKAVNNIFAAKGRPNDNPLIVHISDYEMLELVASAPAEQIDKLMKLGKAYWPGPLTMIVDKDDAIPNAVSCGLKTVGIRMPVNSIAKALIERSGVPIAAPSANISGKPSPTCFKHCFYDLDGKVDVIIDGGESAVGVESTVLDLTGDVPNILRPGAITLENVTEILGQGELYDWKQALSEKPKSPGLKYKHYSPNADVTIYQGEIAKIRKAIYNAASILENAGINVGILTTDDGLSYYKDFNTVLSMGDRDNPLTITNKLFTCLRTFDEMGASFVLSEGISESGVGNAVMNRLYRAAGGKQILVD